MGEHRSLVEACRAVGLDCRCEHLHTEPRFRVAIDQSRSLPLLYLVIRNDDSITPRPVHADPGIPAVLFAMAEKTVRREATMDIWLPYTELHRYVAWREGETWLVERLSDTAGTAAEAVQMVRKQFDEGATQT